jgi:hypothetical protein
MDLAHDLILPLGKRLLADPRHLGLDNGKELLDFLEAKPPWICSGL